MRKFTLFLLVMTSAIAVPVAHADQPTFIPLTASDAVLNTCGYPVAQHIGLNGQTARVFSDGTVLITGPLSVQFSANGKTVSANISGPAKITTNPDGSFTIVSEGVSGGLLQTANGVIIAIFAGPVLVDPTTGLPSLVSGRVLVNVCDALAP